MQWEVSLEALQWTSNKVMMDSFSGFDDDLTSPSAQIVAGKLIGAGTGSFELLKSFTDMKQRAPLPQEIEVL